MAVINIAEIDNTTYTQRDVAVDNTVFVPGTAITGPDEPTFVKSFDEFIKLFGDKSPDDNSSFGTTWDYAANILLAGFPVLFKRISSGTYQEPVLDESGNVTYDEQGNPVFNTVVLNADKATGTISVSLPTYNVAVNTGASNVSDVTVDASTFESKVQTLAVHTYTFTYSEDTSKWSVAIDANASEETTLADFGVTVPTEASLTSDSKIVINVTEASDGNGGVLTEDVTVANVSALYGGTYSNNLSVNFYKTESFIYVRTFRTTSSVTALENVRLCAVKSSPEATVKAIKDAIGTGLTTEYVSIVLTEDVNKISPQDFPFGVASVLTGGTDVTDEQAVNVVEAIFEETAEFNLSDIYIYDIKFLTSGGLYLNANDISLYRKMVTVAQRRGDCIAVLDIPYGTTKDEVVNGNTTYFSGLSDINCSYATAFAPWMFMALSTKTSGKWMSPSYAFLHTLARSISGGNRMWETPAGVNRGTVSEVIKPEYDIGSAILDAWQNTGTQFVNPIMRLRNYGYVLYGQKTLYKNVDGALGNRSALQELGVRLTAIEIKRFIVNVALGLTFEPNTYKTWLAFKSTLDPYLLEMKTYGALIDYEIIMDESTTTVNNINENVVNGIVRVNIARAAEDFEISLELSAAGVTFTANEEEIY